MKITKVFGRRIFDSRSNPTVEARVYLENGVSAAASVPSGASTGSYEAVELRDGGKAFGGLDVTVAVYNINTIINDLLKGMDVYNQFDIDKVMNTADGTDNKSNLGANAILAVSLAAAEAAAKSLGIPLFRYLGGINSTVLPMPMMNILNGGKHADNNANIQEFMIVPVIAHTFADAMNAGVEVYHALKSLLKEKGLSTAIGDEGGFAPNMANDEQGLQFIMQAVEKAGFKENEISIALDIAATEWVDGSNYRLIKTGEVKTKEELFDYYGNLVKQYPIISIEDPLGENDFDGFAELTRKFSGSIQIVGDDLFVTNEKRLKKGISKGSGNAILIKPNQIGTLTETMNTIKRAQTNGFKTIISHRSGETENTFIADLAVAVNAGQIKTGAPCRSERVCKYNRLLEIEQLIKNNC